ncbi:hypothetical protein [Novipirellula artificiosorum]|uniref:Uncharacterized protein n=1 Tax=Novipirellula artificiosorum TaxID=2528016 RepID=A0A5C6CUX4_9BACT|nr:hypothetical protein [Novipirellula artificiosorum]TWU28783.1 hypothetical protein Poly41_68860 [Novipirellula artificiosorum]
MKRVLGIAAAFVAMTALMSSGASAEDAIAQWLKFFQGDWVRESTQWTEDGKTQNTYQWSGNLVAGGTAFYSTGTCEWGEYSMITGVEAGGEKLFEYASASDGTRWRIVYEVKDDKTLVGKFDFADVADPNNNGNVTITKTSDDSYLCKWNFTADGVSSNGVEKNTRLKAHQSTLSDFQELANLFEGHWTGKVTWVRDLEGMGKRGETVTMLAESKPVSNGKSFRGVLTADTGSLDWTVYFDASAKQIKSIVLFPDGTVNHNVYYKEDDHWVEIGQGSLADGTKTTYKGTFKFADDSNSFVADGSSTSGDEADDERHDIWTRIGKSEDEKRSAEDAFKAWGNYAVGGVWTPEGDETNTVHYYQWVEDQKLLKLTTHSDSESSVCMIGVDPTTDQMTWWGFPKDGKVIVSRTDSPKPGSFSHDWFNASDGSKLHIETEIVGDDRLVNSRDIVTATGERTQDTMTWVRQRGGSKVIPEKAIKAMESFIGTSSITSKQTDDTPSTGCDKRIWLPGGQTVVISSVHVKDGKSVFGNGTCGWDSNGNALVERWFDTTGLCSNIRYPLDKITDEQWEGTFIATFGDGIEREGTCVLKFTETGREWTAIWQQDDQEMVYKNVAKSVE